MPAREWGYSRENSCGMSSDAPGSGKKILGISDVHPGAATLRIEQPIVRSMTNPSGQSGKPLGRRCEAFRRNERCGSDNARSNASNQDLLIAEAVHEASTPTTQGANSGSDLGATDHAGRPQTSPRSQGRIHLSKYPFGPGNQPAFHRRCGRPDRCRSSH